MLLFVCSNFRTILQQDLVPEVCLDYLEGADVLTEEEVGVWAKKGYSVDIPVEDHVSHDGAECRRRLWLKETQTEPAAADPGSHLPQLLSPLLCGSPWGQRRKRPENLEEEREAPRVSQDEGG